MKGIENMTLAKHKTAVPKHIGIILDGNRRFAKRLMMKPWQGYEWGTKKVEKLLDWCREYDIKELTLYCFSIENFHSRPKNEFDYLMDLFHKEFVKIKDDERLAKHKIRLNFIGHLSLFPQKLQDVMKMLMEKTKDNTNYIVNFAMAYGGQDEIVDAAKKIAEQVKEGKLNIDQINKEIFANALYIKSEPDIVIRTGGEKRTSNFLPFQTAYSEWIYLEKMWPEFEKEDFEKCIEEYQQRQRRFGQ